MGTLMPNVVHPWQPRPDQSKMDAYQRSALQLMLTDSPSQYRLLPPLTQTFCEAATEDAYQMACSHSRACGLTMIGISTLVFTCLRAVLHLTGYLTDENAPLRNSPAVVGYYVLTSVAAGFLFSFGLYCMQSNKRAMEMRKPLHNCTRAAMIAIFVPLSLLTWLTCSVRNVEGWEWFWLGAVTFTAPFLLSAMRLSVIEIVIPPCLLLLNLWASPAGPPMYSVLLVVSMMLCLVWYLCWLEQNHRGAFLTKLNVIRLQSELQASETSRLEEKTHSLLSSANSRCQKADLERAKVQLLTMTCAPSEELKSSESLRQITKVQRQPQLKKAWETAGGGVMDASTSNPKFPCIAVTSTDDVHYSGRALSTKGVIAKEKVIREGSHSFVKVPGEAHLRVSSMAKTFGSCPGRPMLASESQVQYAGEIEFDGNQQITRWSNMSGTYQCPDNTAFQAGLPLDKFYAVRTEAEVRLSGGLENNTRLFRAENGVMLEKILGFTEDAFMEVQASWNQHQSSWLAKEHDARACHERLIRMMRKLQAAISKYGYLSESTDVWSSSTPEKSHSKFD